jgi:magnesium transporter
MVGTEAEEIKATSVLKILSLRLPWLFVSIVSGLTCAFITDFFQHNIQAIAALFLFIPVILGLSESTAVQGATIVVRNLTLGDLSLKDLGGIFIREISVGIFIGMICSVIVGVVAYIWQGNYLVGMALAASMALTISISALIGLILPIVFKTFKIDPAMASGPLVLAICDLQTLFVYFSLSGIILKG